MQGGCCATAGALMVAVAVAVASCSTQVRLRSAGGAACAVPSVQKAIFQRVPKSYRSTCSLTGSLAQRPVEFALDCLQLPVVVAVAVVVALAVAVAVAVAEAVVMAVVTT